MSRYGFRPAVFLPTGYIGDTVYQFKGRDCLTWKEVRELHGAGVSFGSHTVSHPQLQFVSRKQQDDELRQSKEIIENKIGTPIQSFAYPFAFPEDDREFVRQLRHNLQDSGYENGVSTMVGTVGPDDDTYFLKRLPVNSWDDLSLFKAKLEGGYDWLHGIQCASKFIRSGVEQWRSVKAGTTSSSRL
jgi:peptidoglycan/xylan/chitin deacetylase (PgdA/CDA1 family)